MGCAKGYLVRYAIEEEQMTRQKMRRMILSGKSIEALTCF